MDGQTDVPNLRLTLASREAEIENQVKSAETGCIEGRPSREQPPRTVRAKKSMPLSVRAKTLTGPSLEKR